MHDGRISLTSTLAWVAWGLSGLFTLATTLTGSLLGQTTTGGMVLCTIGIIFAAVAATIHIRSFFCKFLACSKNAYELGRDAGRAEVLAEPGVPVQRIH